MLHVWLWLSLLFFLIPSTRMHFFGSHQVFKVFFSINIISASSPGWGICQFLLGHSYNQKSKCLTYGWWRGRGVCLGWACLILTKLRCMHTIIILIINSVPLIRNVIAGILSWSSNSHFSSNSFYFLQCSWKPCPEFHNFLCLFAILGSKKFLITKIHSQPGDSTQ